MSDLKEYVIVENGEERTFLLSDEDAERAGAKAVTPRNKQVTPKNKR